MKSTLTKTIALFGAMSIYYVASATPTIVDPGPDPFGDLGLGPEDVIFVAEARNVDPNTGDWEIGLGHYVPDGNGGYNYVSDGNEHLTWENGTENSFSLIQDSEGNIVFAVGDKTVSDTYGATDDIFVEAVTRSGGEKNGLPVYNCSVKADVSSFNEADLEHVGVLSISRKNPVSTMHWTKCRSKMKKDFSRWKER